MGIGFDSTKQSHDVVVVRRQAIRKALVFVGLEKPGSVRIADVKGMYTCEPK